MNRLRELYRSVFVQQAVKGTLWLTLGSFLSKGLVVLAYLLLAHILSVQEYGEYSMLKATIDNFLIFATMGVGITVTKYIVELKKTDSLLVSKIVGISLMAVVLLSTLLFLIITFFSETLATSFLSNQELATSLIIAGGVLVFVAIATVLQGALLGLQQYRSIFIVHCFQGVLLLAGLTIGGYFYGVLGAILGNLIATVCMAIVGLILLKRGLQQEGLALVFSDSRRTLHRIAKFAIPASLAMLVGAPAIWLMNAQLVNTPNGYEQLGIYSAALIFALALRTINTAIGNAVLPLFLDVELVVTKRKQFFNYHGAWLTCLAVSLPLLLFPELGSWLLGSEYPEEVIEVVIALSIVSTLSFSFKQGISRDLIRQNKMWYSAFSMLLWAVILFVVFYFVQHLGAIGFAIAFCSAYLLNTMIAVPFYIYKKITPRQMFFSGWLFPLLLLIAIFIAVNLSVKLFFVRMVASVFLLFLISIAVKKFYNTLVHPKS